MDADLDSCRFIWLPGANAWLEAHRSQGQQPDNLCGPYWLSVLLKGLAGVEMSPAAMGFLAQSVLPQGVSQDWLPRGACSCQDYEVALPQTIDLIQAGTAVPGLIEAVAIASNQSYCLVPLQTHWTTDCLDRLLMLCLEFAHWRAVPVANWQTGYLWGSQLASKDALNYLDGAEITPPPPDWAVGHFAAVVGKVYGSHRSLFIVRDTYPHFGWDGHHLQPGVCLAKALNRQPGEQGGILLFLATKYQTEATTTCRVAGFEVAPWDNGSPWRPRNT